MKKSLISLALFCLALAGCVVAPGGPAYYPAPAYYGPAYYGPPVFMRFGGCFHCWR